MVARSLRGRFADVLEATGARRRGDLLRLATWQLEAGEADDPERLTGAAQRALLLLDYGLAERLARAASEAGGGFESDHILAQALSGLGEMQAADTLLRDLEERAGDDDQRVKAASTRAYNLAWHQGRMDDALEVLRRAEDRVVDPASAAELTSSRIVLLVLMSRLDQADGLAADILSRDEASDRARVQALKVRILVRLKTGRVQEADGLRARQGRGLEEALAEYPVGAVENELCRFLSGLYGGRFREVADELEQRYRVALRRQVPGWVTGNLAGMTGMLRRVEGRPETPVRWLQGAYGLLNEGDLFGFMSTGLAEGAHSLAMMGDAAAAEETLAASEVAEVPAIRATMGFTAEARVWVTAARGEISAAVALAHELAAEAGSIGLLVPQAGLLHQAVRLDTSGEVLEPLQRLAEVCDTPVVGTQAAHAAALAADDGAGLLAVADRFEAMGAMLWAAEAATQAARAFRAAGERGSALTAAARAAALLEHCEQVTTPALADLDTSLPVTAREREVALLAARGLTNREIADRLVISLRTVDNHLHHAYTKLGIDGREELAPILGLGADPVTAGVTRS